jgi:hypothetical protein
MEPQTFLGCLGRGTVTPRISCWTVPVYLPLAFVEGPSVADSSGSTLVGSLASGFLAGGNQRGCGLSCHGRAWRIGLMGWTDRAAAVSDTEVHARSAVPQRAVRADRALLAKQPQVLRHDAARVARGGLDVHRPRAGVLLDELHEDAARPLTRRGGRHCPFPPRPAPRHPSGRSSRGIVGVRVVATRFRKYPRRSRGTPPPQRRPQRGGAR